MTQIPPCFDCPVPPAVRYVPSQAEWRRYARQIAPPITAIKPEVNP